MILLCIFFVIVPLFVNCSVTNLNRGLCSSIKTVNYTTLEWHIVTHILTYSSNCASSDWYPYYKSCTKTKRKNKLERRPVSKQRQVLVHDCCEGYARTEGLSIADDIQCHPICTEGCENGTCIGPNECVCEAGYEFNDGTCKPICRNDCGSNGTCTAPDECECDDGYNYHHDTLLCIPHCQDGCENGTCVSPNKCECMDGYEFINGTCEPVCKNNCGTHGTCTAPDECLCDDGYKYHPKSLLCVPHCAGGCISGKCVNPNVCICGHGYELNHGECKPVCKSNCDLHGICVAPDTCICNWGFKYDHENPLLCRPLCPQGCENGTCIGPNECVCEAGYEFNNGTCKPICRNDCGKHGTCTAPDECVCDDGYDYNQDTLLCIPHCSDGCDNGTCVRPNECECADDYELINGKCQLYYETSTSNLEGEQMTTEIDNDDYDSTTYTRELTSTSQNVQDGKNKSIALESKEKSSGAPMWMYVGLPIAILALVAVLTVVVVRLNKWNSRSGGAYIFGGTSTAQLVQDTDPISIHYSSSAPTCECRN